jgi:hypothetical protein
LLDASIFKNGSPRVKRHRMTEWTSLLLERIIVFRNHFHDAHQQFTIA